MAMTGIRRARYGIASTGAAMAFWGALWALGQNTGRGGPAAAALPQPPTAAQWTSSLPATALGKICDPSTGYCWLLVRNPAHPEEPARWLPASGGILDDQRPKSDGTSAGKAMIRDVAPSIVIRPGDRLVVEEHSSVVDARLEAVALNAAAPGGELRARLGIGGRVVRVLALECGRARVIPESERPR
jgi:hypothetical protein